MSTNEAYIAYPESSAGVFVVQKFNGNIWTQVGANIGNTGGLPTRVALAFDASSNEAYIAYPDGAINVFVVQKFYGTNWIQVGNNMGSTGEGIQELLLLLM